jgi:hypothetical protein
MAYGVPSGDLVAAPSVQSCLRIVIIFVMGDLGEAEILAFSFSDHEESFPQLRDAIIGGIEHLPVDHVFASGLFVDLPRSLFQNANPSTLPV